MLTDIFLLPPSRLMRFIWEKGPARFGDSVIGEHGEKMLQHFWDVVTEWEPYRDHPVVKDLDPALRCKLIPLFLFVDGYEVHRRSEYYAWLWCGGLARTGSSYDSVFPIAAVRHACMPTKAIKQMVFWEMYRYIASDLEWMSQGLTRDGLPLTDNRYNGYTPIRRPSSQPPSFLCKRLLV